MLWIWNLSLKQSGQIQCWSVVQGVWIRAPNPIGSVLCFSPLSWWIISIWPSSKNGTLYFGEVIYFCMSDFHFHKYHGLLQIFETSVCVLMNAKGLACWELSFPFISQKRACCSLLTVYCCWLGIDQRRPASQGIRRDLVFMDLVNNNKKERTNFLKTGWVSRERHSLHAEEVSNDFWH